jgi:APA family basic amino acid/polyamine antiporter
MPNTKKGFEMALFRTKPIAKEFQTPASLKRCLTAFDLTLLGIGAIIGAGVFVLTGVAAATKAGPAITISYIISGLASLFSALAYAELAASVGGCGSAYHYSYASFGELIAWIIGWDLLLEYSMSVSTVAIGWSGYVNNALQALHLGLPLRFQKNPFEGGLINLPAVLIITFLATLLCIGIKQSSRFNDFIVFVKLCVIAFFIVIASQYVNVTHWENFFPFGMTGVMNGAALVFFAYIGFDAVSTAAEEAINPQRDLPIGIIVSVVVCTLIYIIVAALLTGIVPYSSLNVPSPVSDALLRLGHPVAAGIIALGAVAGLTTVMLVMYYGLTRVCLAISRDGLLPPFFARIAPQTQTPVLIIILSGLIIAGVAGFVPIEQAAELVNIGTLAAFTLVCMGVMILRKSQPNLPRPFKLPFYPFIPLLGAVFCLYLMLHLNWITWLRFLVWLLIGLIIYFAYGRKNSKLYRKKT